MNGFATHEYSTGESAPSISAVDLRGAYLRNTLSSLGRSSLYDVPIEQSGAQPQVSRLKKPTLGDTPSSPQVAPAERYAIGHFCKRAIEAARRMKEAATSGDYMDLAEVGILLRDNLRELWKRRNLREEPWAEIVNLLQGSLASVELETLLPTQCETISKVVESYLGAGTVGEEDVSRARRELQRGDLDPWRAISAPDPND
jgi:hypothetical protein